LRPDWIMKAWRPLENWLKPTLTTYALPHTAYLYPVQWHQRANRCYANSHHLSARYPMVRAALRRSKSRVVLRSLRLASQVETLHRMDPQRGNVQVKSPGVVPLLAPGTHRPSRTHRVRTHQNVERIRKQPVVWQAVKAYATQGETAFYPVITELFQLLVCRSDASLLGVYKSDFCPPMASDRPYLLAIGNPAGTPRSFQSVAELRHG
jgi:hypothetical protein